MSYDCTGGSLKLKGVSDKKICKKKRCKTSANEIFATVSKPDGSHETGAHSSTSKHDSHKEEKLTKIEETKKALKTRAEIAFEKAIDKRMEENTLKRAAKSHKEHVEVFNKHLESLSEFHDIPKVSWTK